MENLFHFFSIFGGRDIGHDRFLHIDMRNHVRGLFYIGIIMFDIVVEGGPDLDMHVGFGRVDDLRKINSGGKVFPGHVLGLHWGLQASSISSCVPVVAKLIELGLLWIVSLVEA